MNKKHSLMIFMIVASFVFAAQFTSACSCIAREYTPSERLAESEAIFVGRVNSIDSMIGDYLKVEISITDPFKGVDLGEKTIYTYQDSAGCGYNFEEGKEYLIIVSYIDGSKMITGLCDGNLLASEAQDKISEYRRLTLEDGVVCTQEAKLCPDGSYVGRNSSNNCAFDQCPMEEPIANNPNAFKKFWNWLTDLFN